MPRRIDVSPGRFPGWIETFAGRHGGGLNAQAGEEEVTFTAADGATAVCRVPFPPFGDGTSRAGSGGGSHALPGGDPALPADLATAVAAHATADRTVGVLLVRLGGYAAGVFTGTEPVLAASKVGSRLVHGRSAAGGQSQRRFARRRENQASQALSAAADTAAAVFAPYQLDALVLGGDRRAFAPIRSDLRLAPYFAVAVRAFLTVPDPRLTVLKGTPRLFRAISIALDEPA